MESKVCVICDTEKRIDHFYNKYKECTQCKFEPVRTAHLKRIFSEGDTTNWSHNLYKVTEIINDTIRRYKFDSLPESYKESLPKKTFLTEKENDNVMKKITLG